MSLIEPEQTFLTQLPASLRAVLMRGGALDTVRSTI
jgi:hypothetical protein